jgi:acetoin utilization deacetylase AcuC-like enzyme
MASCSITVRLIIKLTGFTILLAVLPSERDLKSATDSNSENCLVTISKIKVAYDDRMIAPSEHSISDSSEKPLYFMNALEKSGRAFELTAVTPLSRNDFYLTHSPDYVDSIFNLQQENGFGNRSPRIRDSLPWTSGSLYAAARAALKDKIAVSPTSGFHHAGYACNWGFCTFNGLMVTAVKLLKEGHVRKVAIIDADKHIGDGTEQIRQQLKLQESIFHYSFGMEFHYRGQVPFIEEAYLERMDSLEGMLQLFEPDLIIYQAGADPHENDPMGDKLLSTGDMRKRDRRMFEIAYLNDWPIVWNLAGGYQRDKAGSIAPVIQLHLNTFDEAMKIYGQDGE